jgi:hypothetical protein
LAGWVELETETEGLCLTLPAGLDENPTVGYPDKGRVREAMAIAVACAPPSPTEKVARD